MSETVQRARNTLTESYDFYKRYSSLMGRAQCATGEPPRFGTSDVVSVYGPAGPSATAGPFCFDEAPAAVPPGRPLAAIKVALDPGIPES